VNVVVCGIAPHSNHFRTYVDFLVRRGHDVTVLTDSDSMDAPVRLVNLAEPSALARSLPRGGGLALLLWRLRKALRADAFDVLDVMQVSPLGVYAAWMWGGPLLLDFWGSDILRLSARPWFIRRLMRRVVAKADRIHAVSREMEQALLSLGADEANIETFQYGIDLSAFELAPGPRTSEQILCARGLREFYRSRTVIRAMPYVLRSRPHARLVLTKDDAPVEPLRALADELGVGDKVTFLGRVPRQQLPAIMRAAAVSVSIPPSDGAPLSLLETMACGPVPVVSDLATMREWLDETRAVFVREVTPEAVGEAILRGLALAEDGSYAVHNRLIVEERGDRAKNLPRWEAMLAAAVDVHGRSGAGQHRVRRVARP
jgi:glycosyltransferase involved in cell wall biosynthesis